MSVILHHKSNISGIVAVPGDKSITHRAILAAALSNGDTKISHFLRCADTVSTIACLQQLGISIEDLGNNEILVHGKGLHGLKKPSSILNVGNSGTTTRLLSAVLSAQDFTSELRGDDAINKRSMKKVIRPLSLMGASISCSNDYTTPLLINGRDLHGISYETNTTSVQTKSAILFAGLYADNPTTIIEPVLTRDHTERILMHFGAELYSNKNSVTIKPNPVLTARDLDIPGDLSSAAFLIAAALILPDSELTLKRVSVNEHHIGFLKAVREMGGDIRIANEEVGIEPCADIIVKSSRLHGVRIEKEMIPETTDELPILCVLACFAEGETVITDASELKYKETNRIDALVENLSRMGADIEAEGNEMIIHGGMPLHGAIVGSRLDHRIAMCMAIAGILAQGTTELIGSDCVKMSYPDFYKDLEAVAK